MRICGVDGCGATQYVKGFCRLHYKESRQSTMGECSIDRCDVVQFARGWCSTHYHRNRNYGSPHNKPPTGERAQWAAQGITVCIVDGCGIGPIVGHGYCRLHYTRNRKHGDPNIVLQSGNQKGSTRSPLTDEHKKKLSEAGKGKVLTPERRKEISEHMKGNTNGIYIHGWAGTREYKTWKGLIYRCTNPNSQGWEHYGGRGIDVCERWLESFENFLEDMGEKPEGLSIDRIDNDKCYYPENCRWATAKEQRANQRPYTYKRRTKSQVSA